MLCVREVLHEPSEAQATRCWLEASLILLQSVCGIANCLTLMFKEDKQAFVFTLDQRCVERHESESHIERGQNLSSFQQKLPRPERRLGAVISLAETFRAWAAPKVSGTRGGLGDLRARAASVDGGRSG